MVWSVFIISVNYPGRFEKRWGYSILIGSKSYQLFFLTLLLIYQYFLPQAFADNSKTVERLIELTEPTEFAELTEMT